MADTVDDARQRLAYVLSEYIDEVAEAPPVKAAIDAYAAAVRAENAQHLNTCEIHADVPGIAYRTGCAVCLTEAVALIAAVRADMRPDQCADHPTAAMVDVCETCIEEQIAAVRAENAPKPHYSDPDKRRPYEPKPRT